MLSLVLRVNTYGHESHILHRCVTGEMNVNKPSLCLYASSYSIRVLYIYIGTHYLEKKNNTNVSYKMRKRFF